MTEQFLEGERYRFDEIKDVTSGPGGFADEQLFTYRGGVFEPEYEPFVDGETYAFEQIRSRTWAPGQGSRKIDPSTMFVYRAGPHERAYFEEVVEPSAYGLVSAAEVHDAIEELLRRGLSARDVARAAGVSTDTAERALSGNGQIRRSTRDALVTAANGVNGGRRNGKASPKRR